MRNKEELKYSLSIKLIKIEDRLQSILNLHKELKGALDNDLSLDNRILDKLEENEILVGNSLKNFMERYSHFFDAGLVNEKEKDIVITEFAHDIINHFKQE